MVGVVFLVALGLFFTAGAYAVAAVVATLLDRYDRGGTRADDPSAE